jgi:protein LTV1
VRQKVAQLKDALPDFIVTEDEIADQFVPAVNPYLFEAPASHSKVQSNLHFDEVYDIEETDEEKEERLKRTGDGIMPDDGYDYSIHFKEPGEGLFVPATKTMQQPPQFVDPEESQPELLATVIGKKKDISAAMASTSAVPMRADVKTIVVKGAKILDDQLDNEILRELESDDEEEEEEASDEEGDDNVSYHSDQDESWDNYLQEMNEGGEVDEDGNEYFVEEEYEVNEEGDGEYFEDDDFSDDEIDDLITKQLQNREHFSEAKIARLEAKQHLNNQFDFLLKSEYDDYDNYEEAEDRSDKLQLDDEILDNFSHQQRPKNNYVELFKDHTYNDAVQEIEDSDLRRIAANLPNGAIIITEETKDVISKKNVSASEIVKINLKRLEANPRLADELESDDEQYEMVEVDDNEEQKKWDCETIISTYSNLENHPRLITEPITLKGLKRKKKIELSQKSGIPLGILEKKKKQVEEDSEDEEEDDDEEVDDRGKSRNKQESKEEKKLRKAQVKKAKQEKRQQKKALKQAFKEEEKDQSKLMLQQRGLQRVVFKY